MFQQRIQQREKDLQQLREAVASHKVSLEKKRSLASVHFISFEFNFSRIRRVWFSAGSASLTPVLIFCIFLVILAPVCSSAQYLLQ